MSCLVGERAETNANAHISKWVFAKAKWEMFQEVSEETMARIHVSGDIEEQTIR